MKKIYTLGICAAIGLLAWFIPPPKGIEERAIHLFAIFLFTILGIITKPLPMGTISVFGLTLTILTKTLDFAEAFSGFSNVVVWLVVCAFFIARGIIKTGLGQRIAYHLMALLGKSSLGMAYGMVATDLILAPAIPSVTARVGGIIYPVVRSLAQTFGSEPHKGAKRLGAFLLQSTFQGSLISSAMFLTSMAGNPLVGDLASDVGVTILWKDWISAASVPGLIALVLIPLFLYKVYPPTIKSTPDAKDFALKKLKEMGSITSSEWIMLVSFVVLIGLWIFGPQFSLKATTAALIGLSLLLFTQVLTWEDVLQEKGAWNTLVWFSVLVMLATYLNKLGLTKWFSEWVVHHVHGLNWLMAFGVLLLVYFYSHYFFASNIAHISSMYPPFLILSVAVGAPPMLAALILGFFSSLFGGLTHYGCGPAPIYFGSGYIKLQEWWKLGLYTSVGNLAIWLLIGALWWKVIGLY